MSSLERRRRDLPRRRSSGGAHSGRACFMLAHWAGFCLGIGMVAVIRWAHGLVEGWLVVLLAASWSVMFIIGGKKAEKLREEP